MKQKPVLENDNVHLVFTPRGTLDSITDLSNDTRITCKGASHSLWRLTFRNRAGRMNHVYSRDARLLSSAQPSKNTLVMEWGLTSLKTRVTATVSLNDSSLATWDLDVKQMSGSSLWEIQYPIVPGLTTMSKTGRGDKLLVPWGYGVELDNPVDFIRQGGASTASWISEFGQCDTDEGVSKIAYSYPGMWSLQFMAFYNASHTGLYYAAHDGSARLKRFGMYKHGRDSVALIMTHYPDERMRVNRNYSLPYPVKVGTFKGTWHEAAMIYRPWAVKQSWCRKGKLRGRNDIPTWLKENDFWYWNWSTHMRDSWQALPELAAPTVVALKEKLDCNIAFHWYGSLCEPFNLRIPELFPTHASALIKLRRGLSLMHKHGIHAIPYLNPRLCDPVTETWQKHDVKAMTCKTDASEVHYEEYIEGLPWATVCPSRKRWHKIIVDICRECMRHGYDGVYIDQVSSCYAVPCFDGNHGHPRGGGNTWYQGNRDMVRKVQEACKTKHSCFTSESTVECFNDVLDANLARMATRVDSVLLGCRNARPVPVCNAVYHDYIITYGSTTRLDMDRPDLVYLGGALTMISGNQLSFEGIKLRDFKRGTYKDYLRYYRTLCRFRKKHRDYFNLGTWAPPVKMKAAKVTLDLSQHKPRERTAAVLTGTWRLDGKSLVFFVNHTAEKHTVTATIGGRKRDITIPARGVKGFETREGQER